jgi:hypothetical protein
MNEFIMTSSHSPRVIPATTAASGFVVTWFALLLPVLLGFAVLVVDLAHVMVVRSELQNAADAAALAGAAKLTSPGATVYNWTNAAIEADASVGLNKADGGTPLVKGVIETGWWNVQTGTGLRGVAETPTTYDKPAVRVTIRRSSDVDGLLNGGPLRLFFAPVFDQNFTDISVTAVAMISAPGMAEAGTLFPFAVGKCMYDQFWDVTTNTPKIDPATGAAYVFNFGSIYFSSCLSGEWTTFRTTANDVPSVRDLITNGNPDPYLLGENTYIQPGVKTTLYDEIPLNKDILVAVIDGVTPGTHQPIYAFAGIHVDAIVVITGKRYIQGHFISNSSVPGIGPGPGGGTYYGTYVPPMMVH